MKFLFDEKPPREIKKILLMRKIKAFLSNGMSDLFLVFLGRSR